jgi:DNA glycosylase AlkZ-like
MQGHLLEPVGDLSVAAVIRRLCGVQTQRVTFTRPEDASIVWCALPAPEDAAPLAMTAYLRAHGPATVDAFGNWLAGGWFGERQLRAWFGTLDDRVAEVNVDGERMYVLAEDADELAATSPTSAVRLLPGSDQLVLAPGTADAHVVPPSRRPAVSRQAGWISPVVVAGGVVSGTWELDGNEARIAWFRESGRLPRKLLVADIARLGEILGRDVGSSVSVVD